MHTLFAGVAHPHLPFIPYCLGEAVGAASGAGGGASAGMVQLTSRMVLKSRSNFTVIPGCIFETSA